jgi:hypothetical protein
MNYRSNHNVATDNFKDHYISYNWKDTYIYGQDTTAIVIGQMQRFYILNGNHFENLKELNTQEAFDYFLKNQELINEKSNKFDIDDALKVIKEYREFKILHGYNL